MHHDLDIRWDTASERNLRATNADAVATRRDPATGELVFAVADGIGDTAGSAEAARKAAAAAVATPVAQGAIQAMIAAQQALLLDEDDCVLVVAMPFTDRVSSGYRIAWVGDCRAYLSHHITTLSRFLDSWCGELNLERRSQSPRGHSVLRFYARYPGYSSSAFADRNDFFGQY
ncbi:PP2C family serine/threonine-protein phosphatase [Kutzneria sp. 744]|uniref:PP2C family serine/threonine-protein phosphatase n=1 Tax=Kutzneria sp. (strain 744) TaxID=345341 RepID=UPI0003EEDC06|nr:PP2C family serine/threonine-protein phosphatase [Kutzneria sp. 744]EWM11339.1 hypothetical protein KUTG_01643 [Kutzneria sp. 744]